MNILGTNTSNFTASNRLFTDNPSIIYWCFEVVYTFMSERSSSALNFEINQRPQSGYCSITPSNGTTSTMFSILCQDWKDKDGIKDFSFYGLYNITYCHITNISARSAQNIPTITLYDSLYIPK